ncbi:hypothetical protein [Streptomyces sp. NBC_01602]|uniref:hypothetical protein n=1 Tax=Streptomyces sp. NBC_01602 TaxID=2975893 RepID=UPI00386F595D|nr:hypothetical protein OG955_01995 [Streptomyces sp. NBC_01602]
MPVNYHGRYRHRAKTRRTASRHPTSPPLQIALGLTDQFDVAATYGLGELANAVEHPVRPGKVRLVLVRP